MSREVYRSVSKHFWDQKCLEAARPETVAKHFIVIPATCVPKCSEVFRTQCIEVYRSVSKCPRGRLRAADAADAACPLAANVGDLHERLRARSSAAFEPSQQCRRLSAVADGDAAPLESQVLLHEHSLTEVFRRDRQSSRAFRPPCASAGDSSAPWAAKKVS